MTDYEEFTKFIGDTFEELRSIKKNEIQILLYQDWQNNVHKDAKFYELIETKDSIWKIRFSIWSIGKDTSRLLNPIEKIKWRGNIIPSVKTKEIYLSKSERQILTQQISKITIVRNKDLSMGHHKSLRINFNKSKSNFIWIQDKEINESVIILINELKSKT